jgi:hypothetical protein
MAEVTADRAVFTAAVAALREYWYLDCWGIIAKGDIIDFSMMVVVIWQCKTAAPPYVRATRAVLFYFD